jgi:hypothetical protein
MHCRQPRIISSLSTTYFGTQAGTSISSADAHYAFAQKASYELLSILFHGNGHFCVVALSSERVTVNGKSHFVAFLYDDITYVTPRRFEIDVTSVKTVGDLANFLIKQKIYSSLQAQLLTFTVVHNNDNEVSFLFF